MIRGELTPLCISPERGEVDMKKRIKI